MTFVYFLIYNLIFMPVLMVLVHIGALFNRKLRHGLVGRYRLHQALRRHQAIYKTAPVLVMHCASMGEFEHIKPFLLTFKKQRPDFRIIVLFFSPSGFENVKTFPAVDLFLYSPFDWFLPVWRFMRNVKPRLWVIAKHDVWPNQLWMAKIRRIPIFLINASLHRQSGRLLWFTRDFHRSVYRNFTKILTVSHEDRQNFRQLADENKVEVVGDTKYDQVLIRREESLKKKILPPHITGNHWIFVAGSTWPEDQQHLLPAIRELHRAYPQVLSIIIPHEPTEHHLEELRRQLAPGSFILFSELNRFSGHSVIIVDKIGILANLYSVGKVAYVGGSFKQNIHNVLEPAAYEIPVLFGPVNSNSHEAQLLKARGGGFEIHNSAELREYLNKFIRNDIFRQEAGRRALEVVKENAGATDKTVREVLRFLK